jgi:PAS domain S-box-containing protein
MVDPVIIVDQKGTLLEISDKMEDKTGYKKEEFIGKNFLRMKCLTGKTKGIIIKNLFNRMLGGEIAPYEIEVITKDNEIIPFEINGARIDYMDKPVDMIVFRDITNRKKAEEKIKQQNIQLKRLYKIQLNFLNATSHELRTPMSAIKGYVELMLKKELGEITYEQQKALNVVLRNTDRLNHLIEDILDVSRLESGTLKFKAESTNLQEMINESVETMQSSANLKNIKINMDISDDLPGLIIDQSRIRQVIINILNNAIKFSPDGSVINMRVKKQKEDVLFEIQDSGRGISEYHREKIFDAFYQVKSGMDRNFGGVGLGLAIARGIILSHGGKISVKSEVKKGSIFRFTLPLIPVIDLEERFIDLDIFRLKDDKEDVRKKFKKK